MKKSHLVILISVITALPTLAQDRQRFYDNFDTARGVEVYRPPTPATVKAKNTVVKTTAKSSARMPVTKLVKKTALATMSVTDSYALREAAHSTGKLTMGTSSRMNGFTTGDAAVDSYIIDSSRRYGIDPLLIYSQMHQESSFKLKATSPKGASGLMQLMPGTARRLGVTNIYDPKQNIEGGVKYMRMLLDMFGGDVNLALAGYNAGEGAVMKYGNQIPPYNETREYVRRISARYMSISNPSIARTLPQVNNSVIAQMLKNQTRPLNIEQNAVAIKLPDGRMRLVNQ